MSDVKNISILCLSVKSKMFVYAEYVRSSQIQSCAIKSFQHILMPIGKIIVNHSSILAEIIVT